MREKLRGWWKKSGLKTWTDRLPRLSRGKKLALNLALIALAGGWLWGLAGYPLPTAELEFRRLERASLEERSEIVLSLDRELEVQSRDGSRHRFVRPMMVGVTGDRVLVGYASRGDGRFDTLRRYGREDGPTPVPLHPNFVSWAGAVQEDDFYNTAIPMLLVGVPEGAASGGMELEITEWEDGELHLEAPLFDLGNGIWLAPVEQAENTFDFSWYRKVDYTLRLYDEAGALLLEREGTVPRPL